MTLSAEVVTAIGVAFAVVVKGYLDVMKDRREQAARVQERIDRLAAEKEAKDARERAQETLDHHTEVITAIKHDTDGNLAAARVEIKDAKDEIKTAKAELASQSAMALATIQQQVLELKAGAVAQEAAKVAAQAVLDLKRERENEPERRTRPRR